ncbi:choloylglycine hydrolase [Sinobacterium caligoides]|uniref:Choloylglycine hydrolase n=1 Tax=Sinobacterium caligoides TaxID=933926 RepID=A0A3N2DK01_9GAMM|nr:choloylglycine hydrolase family protein [Sinobacterium caligoides]ROS00133.1 choloylglycine hydrolase [Sinobacterium caligoides]
MSKTFWAKSIAVVFLLQSMMPAAMACTGIVLHAKDGTTVPARTMEFGFDIKSNIAVVPANTAIDTLTSNEDKKGFSYNNKYGFAGATALGKPIIVDGMNEKGLYFGAFYFNHLAVYEELTEANQSKAISSEELGNWLLGNFATVEEVKTALSSVHVVGTYIDAIKSFAPLHYAVTDASGKSIVIEYTASGLRIFDNTVNVVANNPTYDWHLTNLNNYIGLMSDNRETITVGTQKLKPFGEGTGLVGLPGDHSSPSRFVRAVAFANTVLPTKGAADTVFTAFHLLNTFDIPKGSIREQGADGVFTDYTVWTSVADTKNVVYYYKTYITQSVEKIDIKKALEGLTKPKIIVMESGFEVKDRSKGL